jgi:hypothetical protein
MVSDGRGVKSALLKEVKSALLKEVKSARMLAVRSKERRNKFSTD